MKKVKSFTNIWNVEKVLYSINDLRLPFPVTFSQMAWFVATEFAIIFLSDIPPFSMMDSAIIKYGVIPVAVTWFMSQKTFDGKKPYRFLTSVLTYYISPKITYGEKQVKLKNEKMNEKITYVRSEVIVPD